MRHRRRVGGWAFAGAIALSIPAAILMGQSGPSIDSRGVVNGASYTVGGAVAPGSIAVVFGNFPVGLAVSASTIPFPTSLADLSIAFGNGEQAPLYYAGPGQVNFQVPWDLGGQQTTATVKSNGQSSAAQSVKLATYAPGIFTTNGGGTGQGVIVDASAHIIDASNPATAGKTSVVIYATGLGPVTNQPANGAPAPTTPLAQTTTTPTVTIGGASATVQFSGLAPNFVGLYQVNVVVPAGSIGGNAVPVSLSIGGVVSSTVTMAVNSTVVIPPPNPAPTISGLSPYTASASTASKTVSITGTGFLSSSAVTFNGLARASNFVDDKHLTVTLTAADLLKAGSFPLTVTNPAPGGGKSNAANFIVDAGTVVDQPGSAGWSGFGRDVRHTGVSLASSQPLKRIRWNTRVDLQPQFIQDELLIHYGSPLITPQNTVLVPVKVGAVSGFRVDAHSASDGTLLWSLPSDYTVPPHDWVPEFGPVLTPSGRLYAPGSGGTVYFRDSPDSATGTQGQIAFYGLSNYKANPGAYDSNVFIDTPITSDSNGNIYFGFVVTGSTPSKLQGGIARISSSGQGIWVSAASAAGDATMTEVVQNCAPALNESRGILYVAVSDGTRGYLLSLNSSTLETFTHVRLTDPGSGMDSLLSDDGTSSPTIGPDGDVYYGVLDNPPGQNHYRGWLLHFNSLLSQVKTSGAFGWDDTASVVPSFMVPSYTGSSSYLLLTKYNDYAYYTGGSGLNRIAILDPSATEFDPLTGAIVMKEIATMLGPTPAVGLAGVKEWCINFAAVDPGTHSVFANSEDGKLYRWNLDTNTLAETIVLTPGLGEAYTPTVIGPDGTVYAINNATLFAVGQ